MRVIAWRIGRKTPVLLNLGAVVSAMFVHVCCWGPILLVPLGFGGVSYFIQNMINSYKPYVYLIPISMLVIGGWKIYRRPKSNLIEKVAYGISVFLVFALMLM